MHFIWLPLIFLSLASCSFFSKGDVVYIGEFISLTGTEGVFGANVHRGTLLALEEHKGRRRVRLVTEDTHGREARTLEVVKTMAGRPEVLGLIGEISSRLSLASAPLAQSAGLPMLSPSATHPGLTAAGSYIFRACFNDAFQSLAMARFSRQKLKVRRAAVLRDDSSQYSRDLANSFIENFQKLGGEVVAFETYRGGEIDFQSQLSHFRSKAPEAIYIPGYYTEAGLIARQARALGLKAHLLGSDGWENKQLFEIGREDINGSYFTNHFSADSDEAKRFVTAYIKKYGSLPDGMAAMGYDAARIMLAAIEKSKKMTREALRDALSETREFAGVTGTISMGQHGEPRKPAFVVQVAGPSNKLVTKIEP